MSHLCDLVFTFLTQASVFFCFLQNYASQSHLDIIVTASLVLDTQAKNMILTAPDAIVSSSSPTALSGIATFTQTKDLNTSFSTAVVYYRDPNSSALPCFDVSSQVKVTVSPENAVAQHSGIPWWIILVAVLVGVLILALLVFLLWKVSTWTLHLHMTCLPIQEMDDIG